MTYTQPSPIPVGYDGEETGTLSFAGHQHPPAAPVALVDGANIALNANLGFTYRVTLAGNRTLSNPTGGVDGQEIRVEITQDATGSRTLAYGTAFDWGTAGAPVLTTTAGDTDILKFIYNAAKGKWRGVLVAKGFS